MAFMLGFIGKADKLEAPARIAVAGRTLVVDDAVTLEEGTSGATATYAGPVEAVIRLLAGRLSPEHTPADAEADRQRHARRPATGVPGLLTVRSWGP